VNRRITLDIPEQPPIGSIVMNAAGVAYQHRHDGVWCPAVTGSGIAWAELIAAHLQLDLIHTPGDEPHQPQADDDPAVHIVWDRYDHRWVRLDDGWHPVLDDVADTRQQLAETRGPLRDTAEPVAEPAS
jgi:hypothetical protein